MGRKGIQQKHTAKEIASKHAAAKHAAGGAGGGAKAAANRKLAGTKSSVKCPICMSMQPNIKSMKLHYDNKHAKTNWSDVEAKFEQEFGGAKASVQKERNDKQSKKEKGVKFTAGGNVKITGKGSSSGRSK
jgi:hypothetical protein